MEESLETPDSPLPQVTRTRPRWAYPLLGVALVAAVLGAYWLKTRPAAGPDQSLLTQGSPDAVMKSGLDLLYMRNNPAGAVPLFRRVLVLNPTHYGATYQLAVALDRSGQPGEA